jgi:hypothetical protein
VLYVNDAVLYPAKNEINLNKKLFQHMGSHLHCE